MPVGDYTVKPFTSPVGSDPQAWQTRNNDNILRDKFNAHQADEVAHVQSGLASAKPASGTVTGEVYIATDTGQMWIWSGSAWVSYSSGGGSGDVVGDDTSTTVQNIVAYNTTGGKNITELTGTQGDVLYHNGTSWAKLAAGTNGHYLKTNGTGANPAWTAVTQVTDGDKGDITVSSSGATWTIDNGVVSTSKMGGDVTTAGKALLDDASAADQRTTLGLGTLATQNGTFSGTSSGTNTGDVSLAGTPDYITISGQTITRGLVDLATDVTGDLPFANLTQATAASKLLGRGSASGAGDWQEITLGTNLTMSGTTLSATGGSGSGDVVGPASATDNGIVRFDGTTGKLIQNNSGATIDDNGKIVTVASSSSTASVLLQEGTSPSTPVNGDLWSSATGVRDLYYYKEGKRWNVNAGYAINVHALSFSPADASTQYFGYVLRAPVTTANQSQMYFNVPGWITAAEIYWYATGVAGTSQNIDVYVRLNNATDYLVAGVATTAAAKRFSNASLNSGSGGIAIVAGDYVEIKMVCPTWPTNPTNVVMGGYITFIPSNS